MLEADSPGPGAVVRVLGGEGVTDQVRTGMVVTSITLVALDGSGDGGSLEGSTECYYENKNPEKCALRRRRGEEETS